MHALKSLSFLSILISLPLLFYIFSLSLQAIQGSQTNVVNSSTFATEQSALIANAPLATPQISISNTLFDEGQPITITATISGGTSPYTYYTYNFIISQYSNPSNIIAFSGPVSNSLTSNSFVWTTNAIGTFVANVIVTDSATSNEVANSIYSNPFTVNVYPTATLLTPSNAILDSGQYVTYNVIINGGTLPITANLIYVSGPSSNNAINGNVPGSVLQTVTLLAGSAEPNTITFNSFELTTTGSYTFNVVAVDSANTPVTFNAVASTVTVSPTTPATSTSTTTSSTSSTTTTTSSSTTTIPIILISSTNQAEVGNIIFSGNIYQSNIINKHAKIRLYGPSTLHGIEIAFNSNTIQPFAMNVVISNSTNSNFYKIINIYESNTEIDNYVSQVVYNFSVPVGFVQEHGISNGNIRLFKQVNNVFVPLPTTYTGTNGTYYFYSAVSNSLSTYVVGFSTSGTTSTTSSASLTVASGYPTYFYALGISPYKKNAYPPTPTTSYANSSIATYSSRSAPYDYTNLASVGYSSSNVGSYSTTGTVSGAALVGIGANALLQNDLVYSANTGTSGASSLSLSYSVTTSNSFVIILFSSGWYNFTAAPTTTASGCIVQQYQSSSNYASAAILTCNSVAAGSYTASVTAGGTSAIAAAAYVFPPYNVILNDNPTTATITTNGNTYTSGSVMQVIGTNAITANKPTTGNWIFNSWSVSNSLNLSIANTLASSTSLTVMGSGIVTATWNGITKFIETGLPTGAKWNVTYDSILNSSTTNTIVFSTLPGTYSFTIPVQKINGVAYEPSTASGSLYSGNAIAITFTPLSVSISPPSNTVVDAGQYETFTATVYNGISPYTYNILVVNSITPSVIAHNDLVSGSSATTLTYTFQTTSADVGNSPEEANVVVTDSFPATVNSVYSSTFTINPAMTTPSISPTSPATYSPGSTVTFSTSFTGGTPPYTYNWLVVNSITGALLANALYTGVSATSNSFAWTIPSADNGNTVVANVIVTDSASTHVTVNSTKSAVITISSVTCTISLGTTAINFGSLDPGTNIATTNAITDSNTGTANAYMYVYGGNWIFSSNTAISFYVANTVWSNNANTAYSSATRLSNLATNTTIFVPAGGSNTIYFGLAVPGGAPVGAYTQNIVIANQC